MGSILRELRPRPSLPNKATVKYGSFFISSLSNIDVSLAVRSVVFSVVVSCGA